jgi:hypothetical protein
MVERSSPFFCVGPHSVQTEVSAFADPMGDEVPSGPRRLGLRAENHASGVCLTMTASARVFRAPAPNRLGNQGCALRLRRKSAVAARTPATWFSD